MGFLDKIIDTNKTSQVKITNPRELYGSVLKQVSGSGVTRDVKFDIFYQIIAFIGVRDGVGCSTLVANTALAIADLGLTVCVVDTSILSPTQDILLKTNYKDKVYDESKRLDWFDMPYTKQSVLHESGLRKNISVLSFYGKNRGVIDMLSVNDSMDLVDMAYTELHTKFDIILVDICSEVTSVNTAALQQSQHVIQVWSDDPITTQNIDNFINKCATLSSPLDKMRNVVFSMIMDDVVGSLDPLAAQYRLTKLGHTVFSKDVRRISVLSKPIYQYATTDEDVITYTECILAIACHICNIREDDDDIIKAQDIMDGKVEGTLRKKLKDENEELAKNAPPIMRTLAEADASLNATNTGDIGANDFAPDDINIQEQISQFKEPMPENENLDVAGEDTSKKKKGLFGRKK